MEICTPLVEIGTPFMEVCTPLVEIGTPFMEVRTPFMEASRHLSLAGFHVMGLLIYI